MLIVKGREQSFSYWPLAISFWGSFIINYHWALLINGFPLVICSSCDYLPKSSVFISYTEGRRTCSVSLYPATIWRNCFTYAFAISVNFFTLLSPFCSFTSLWLYITWNWYLAGLTSLMLHHFSPFPDNISLLCGKSQLFGMHWKQTSF